METINFIEYNGKIPANIEKTSVKGCAKAVIPLVVVDNVEGLKSLAGCFVHVAEQNITFYVDDKHRSIITWAGPVEKDNYDYRANPLNLRSQVVYDFTNNRAIYYNKVGSYRVINLTAGE